MKINMTSLGDTLLPAGIYQMEILECEESVSKAGHPKVVIEFLEPNSRVIVPLHATLQPGKCFTIVNVLRALGANLEPDKEGNVEIDPSDLVGCSLLVELATETYEGRTRLTPRRFMPLSAIDELEQQ